jgi:hypothetical protein
MAKEIRFIGGAWRVIDGQSIRSYTTYPDALLDSSSLEDQAPQMTTDDIQNQLYSEKSPAEANR